MERVCRYTAAILLCLLAAGSAPRAQTGNPADSVSAARDAMLKEGPQAALPGFERALALYRARQDRHGEALVLGYLGNCYERLAEYPKALDYLNKSLAMKKELGDRLEEGKTLNNLGLVYWDMGDYAKAISHLESAVKIAEELHETQLEGATLNNLALISDEQGDYKNSLQLYDRALRLHRETGFLKGESDTLGNIGGDYLLLGQYREAERYYQQALAIDQKLQLKPSITQDLGNLALCQSGIGELAVAIQTFDHAIDLARQAGLPKEEADWHKGKGEALFHLGKYDLARAEYIRALEVYEKAGLKRELVEALNESGTLHARLGDTATAEKDFTRAVDLARSIGNPRGETTNLTSLGDLECRRQRYEQAAALFARAYSRAQRAGDMASMAEALALSALVLRDQGRLKESISKGKQAEEISHALGARLVEAESLYALGDAYRRAGQARISLDPYEAGEKIADSTGDTNLQWRLLYGRGLALESLGQDEGAVAVYQNAVHVIESVRNQLQEERFRAGYLQDKYQVYVSLIHLLLKMGKIGEAFGSSEQLRARSYLDLILSEYPDENSRETELRARIHQLQRAVQRELDRPAAEQRREAVGSFSIALASAERDYATLLDDLRSKNPASAAVQGFVVSSTDQVQESLPQATALMEFVVSEKNVYLFLVTHEGIHARTIPFRRGDLRAKVELLRDLIRHRESQEWEKPAASLYRLLFDPLREAGWLRGIRRIYLVPHSILHYVPFAALPRSARNGTRFLVEDYELAYLPAASALVAGNPNGTHQASLLALAPARARLKYATQEVQSLGTLFAPNHLLLVGDKATEGAFKRDASNYEYIHLATHGFFDRLNPIFSGVQLEPDKENDGRLEVYEILRLHLRARLVTLSACETALGSGYFAEFPAGDEFIGLTRAFLSAGSSAVLATLWEVDDKSTLDLMRAFYRGLSQGNATGALRAAQVRMTRSGMGTRHPYFWAPFIIVETTK